MDELLPDMKKNGDKVLIFSQFVIVLNLLEAYVKIRGYTYVRFDGSTAREERSVRLTFSLRSYCENVEIMISDSGHV